MQAGGMQKLMRQGSYNQTIENLTFWRFFGSGLMFPSVLLNVPAPVILVFGQYTINNLFQICDQHVKWSEAGIDSLGNPWELSARLA